MADKWCDNPYVGGAAYGADFLSNFIGGLRESPQDKLANWSLAQRKNMMGRVKGMSGQPAISDSRLGGMMNNTRQGMAPMRSDMLWRAMQRGGGQASPQTDSMFMREYLPVEAGQMGGMQMQAAQMNAQQKMFWEQLMAQLAGA